MDNRCQIQNLKDYAELAWASYFYFNFLKDSQNIPRKIYALDKQGQKIKDENYPRGYKEIEITLEHIVNQKYYNQEVLTNLKQDSAWQSNLLNTLNEKSNFDKLNGEFSSLQAKNFAKRYKIKFHQSNTSSGFSATLFYDTQKDRFVVGFRGTELNIKTPLEASKDLATDIRLAIGKGDFQVNDLKQFLLDIAPILNNVDSDKIIFVGHSLGGYLAVIAMQFCDAIDRTFNALLNPIEFTASQVYTFNSPAVDGIGNMAVRFLAESRGNNILEQILNPPKVFYLAQRALIYCDSLYKDKLKFSPARFIHCNAPSIEGWNLPSPIIKPNTIKLLQKILDERSIDVSDKITHIYDNGGIKLIASAQYGASNRIPIYTGKDSHSIIPLTQTLYLYSYLLDSQSNYDKVKDKGINECIEYLNTFMQGVYKVFNPLSISINKESTKTQTNESNTATLHLNYLPQVKPNSTYFLSTFIEHILYVISLEKEKLTNRNGS